MAEKLSITIALDGGKAIERQLEGIGAAGQKAFEDIKKSAEAVGGFKNLKPDEVTAGLKMMGITGEDALNKITGAVKEATRMERLVGIVQGLETGFAGLAAAAKLFGLALGPIAGAIGIALVKTMNDAAEAINKVDAAAIKAGLSIEKFDRLQQGLEAAGLSGQQVGSAMDAITAAAEKAKLDQIAEDFKVLQEGAARGFGGQGTAQWQRLTEAMAGGGKAGEAAKKAIIDLGGVISESATKSLPDLINKLGGDVPKAVAAFVEQLRTMPDGANRSSQAIDALGSAAGVRLVQSLRGGLITFDQFKEQLGTLTQEQINAANAIDAATNRIGTAWDRLRKTIGAKLISESDAQQLVTVLNAINALLTAKTWEAWGAAAKQAFVDMFSPIGEMLARLGEFEVKLAGAIWDGFANAGTAAINAIIAALDALWEKLKGIGSAIAGAFGGGGGGPEAGSIPGNARGGLLGGRGSGTSDSNLAWVSRGEHIMPAAAVRQPGVLALLEALRRSGGNLRGVLDGMGRFAAGGVVPRFAEGGLVGGMGHLGTVDLRTDHGSVTLMASGSAMDQLSRLAVTKRMTSTGRKPGFIG